MTALAVEYDELVECPNCEGEGMIVTGYCACCDSMNDERCALCKGAGSVHPVVLA